MTHNKLVAITLIDPTSMGTPNVFDSASPQNKALFRKYFERERRKVQLFNTAIVEPRDQPAYYVRPGDFVLVSSVGKNKTWVARILDLYVNHKDMRVASTQWFHRPNEIAKIRPVDFAENEIFFDMHVDEVGLHSILGRVNVEFTVKLTKSRSVVMSLDEVLQTKFVCSRFYNVDEKRVEPLTLGILQRLEKGVPNPIHVAIKSRKNELLTKNVKTTSKRQRVEHHPTSSTLLSKQSSQGESENENIGGVFGRSSQASHQAMQEKSSEQSSISPSSSSSSNSDQAPLPKASDVDAKDWTKTTTARARLVARMESINWDSYGLEDDYPANITVSTMMGRSIVYPMVYDDVLPISWGQRDSTLFSTTTRTHNTTTTSIRASTPAGNTGGVNDLKPQPVEISSRKPTATMNAESMNSAQLTSPEDEDAQVPLAVPIDLPAKRTNCNARNHRDVEMKTGSGSNDVPIVDVEMKNESESNDAPIVQVATEVDDKVKSEDGFESESRAEFKGDCEAAIGGVAGANDGMDSGVSNDSQKILNLESISASPQRESNPVLTQDAQTPVRPSVVAAVDTSYVTPPSSRGYQVADPNVKGSRAIKKGNLEIHTSIPSRECPPAPLRPSQRRGYLPFTHRDNNVEYLKGCLSRPMNSNRARRCLGLPGKSSDPQEFKRAYRSAMLLYHPDKRNCMLDTKWENGDLSSVTFEESEVRYELARRAYEFLITGVDSVFENVQAVPSSY